MHDVIVVGAGPSGLAVAACLKAQGVSTRILEREANVGSAWRRHYDRLHLHTARDNSGLPMRPMPKGWPRYVPREQVVDYLEDYAAHFGLTPIFGTEVTGMERTADGWILRSGHSEHKARAVVLATGFADAPKSAQWPGQKSFPGQILHSRDYRRPSDLTGQRVLVVGFGNSGGEIAIDLAEDGREVTMAVRSPVNLIPKELFGRPIAEFSLAQKLFGYRVADVLSRPLMKWAVGEPSDYGLKPAGKGPLAQIVEDNRIPLIDIGTLDLIKDGRIAVRGGVVGSDGAQVRFDSGAAGEFDAILMATGYTVNLRPMLGEAADLDDEGRPHVSGEQIAPGLWGISYHAVPNGQLAAIARQAPKVAEQIVAALSA